MKITKSKLKQIIQEELKNIKEAHASGGGGSGSEYRRGLRGYADLEARQRAREAEEGPVEPELEATEGEDSSITLAKLAGALEDIGALSPMIQNLLDKLRGAA